MRQLSKAECIEIGSSKVWESWSDEKIVAIQLFQRLQCVDFRRYMAALSTILGRPVSQHELMRSNKKRLQAEYLGLVAAPELTESLNLLTKRRSFWAWLGF